MFSFAIKSSNLAGEKVPQRLKPTENSIDRSAEALRHPNAALSQTRSDSAASHNYFLS
jgi:hypothetical protein